VYLGVKVNHPIHLKEKTQAEVQTVRRPPRHTSARKPTWRAAHCCVYPSSAETRSWELALPENGVLAFKYMLVRTVRIRGPPPPPALLQVCTAIRRDTMPVWYGNQAFSFLFNPRICDTADLSSFIQHGLAAPLQYARKMDLLLWRPTCTRTVALDYDVILLRLDLNSSNGPIKWLQKSRCEDCRHQHYDEPMKEAIVRVLGDDGKLSLDIVKMLCDGLVSEIFLESDSSIQATAGAERGRTQSFLQWIQSHKM
jgi:hypothetical protein